MAVCHRPAIAPILRRATRRANHLGWTVASSGPWIAGLIGNHFSNDAHSLRFALISAMPPHCWRWPAKKCPRR
jgi:hypothetical protein